MSATTLYRFYGDHDELLYIGISSRIHRRIQAHRAFSSWWALAVRATLERFPTRAAARKAEALAIYREQPSWNRQGITSTTLRELVRMLQDSPTLQEIAIKVGAPDTIRYLRSLGAFDIKGKAA